MSELSILNKLVASGMTPIGACAMAGNMQAESALRANNAQDGMTKLSDEEYTAAVDSGDIEFSHDGVGYGLCQWTYPMRKAKLYIYAYEHNKSIGDEAMQVQFCIEELKTDYSALWTYLCQTQDLAGATGRICTEYERPAINNTSLRTMYANELYMRYGDNLGSTMNLVNPSTASTDNQKKALNFAMPVIKRGDRSPEAHYLRKLLDNLGYDTVWSGLWSCLVDYQQKRGLTVDGICGEQTWKAITQEGKG